MNFSRGIILTGRRVTRLLRLGYVSLDLLWGLPPSEFLQRFRLSDRDSGRWKVDPAETQRRRELFWEMLTYDSWQCLTFGRPPSFALPHIDCRMPFVNDSSDEQACKFPLPLYRTNFNRLIVSF
jgi:hypothetical protein